jgi:hypothetical protein
MAKIVSSEAKRGPGTPACRHQFHAGSPAPW